MPGLVIAAWEAGAAVSRLLKIQVEQTDREIDVPVHDLYGLSPGEIAIAEAAMAKTG